MNSAIHSSISGRSRADRAFRGTSRSSINWNSYQGSPICPAKSRTRHLRLSAHPFKKRFPTATLKAPMCLGAGTFQSLSKHIRERQIVANKWLIGTHQRKEAEHCNQHIVLVLLIAQDRPHLGFFQALTTNRDA